MKHSQDNKIVLVTAPGAIIDNAAVATTAIDTLGFEEADIFVILGATDVALAALKLQESDQAGSGYADIAGADYADALPSATDDNKTFGFHVDMRGRKRFLDVVATGGDGTVGTYITIVAILSRAKQSPNTAAKRGLAAEKFV